MEVMEDLIGRQAAIEVLKVAYKNLETLPSAQPERQIGRWIRNDNGTYTCSVCHSWIPKEQYYYARYCLYCGAKMKGDNNDNT